MENQIEFSDFSRLKDYVKEFSQLEDSYIYCHITPGDRLPRFTAENHFKYSGIALMMVMDCTPCTIHINQQEVEISPNTILHIHPGAVLQFDSPQTSDLDAYVLLFDTRFLQNVNVSLSSVKLPALVKKPQPDWKVSQAETELICRYIELLHLNSLDSSNLQISRHIAASVIAALFYQLVGFYHKSLEGSFGDRAGSRAGRRSDYVREVVKLVNLHYFRERTVSFYSEKLCISPKYLSMLVKEVTGRSAAKWIDDFVITEAKNMLKFSGKNIQQVAYSLNFPTQSSFGKYFKHLTGMSPTEYQKS